MGGCQSSLPLYNACSDEDVYIPQSPTRSKVYRHPERQKHKQDQRFNWKTARDIFQAGLAVSSHTPCLGQRERHPDGSLGQFQWLTYQEVEEASLRFGTAVTKLNLCPEKKFEDELYPSARCLRPLGVFAKNCPEWLIVEQSANAFNYTLIPLYDTMGEDSLVFIAQQTQMECIVVSDECLFTLNRVIHGMPTVKSIILLDARPWATTAIPSVNAPQRVAHTKSFSNALQPYSLVNLQEADGSTAVPSTETRRPVSASTTTSVGDIDGKCVSCPSETMVATSQLMDNPVSGADRSTSDPLCSIPLGATCPIHLYCWTALMAYGATESMQAISIDPDSVQSICYTSGTSGQPKGVVVTHRGLVSNLMGLLMSVFLGTHLELQVTDVHISFLPLAHIYERIMCQLFLSAGAAIGVYSGDILKLFGDVKTLRPTVFVGVPRVYAKILDRIQAQFDQESALVQYLYQRGLRTKIYNLHSSSAFTHPIYDSLIFNKIRDKVMGGRVRYLICAAAALHPSAHELLQVIFSVELMSAYGLTESIGAALIGMPGDRTTGHVGGVVSWAEMCLESVPEMNADALGDPPRGEILLRGDGLSKGYFMEPELTRKSFTEGGWYRTGDIGELSPTSNALRIVDRKKDIFKLSQGEYITPDRIESVYTKALLIGQIFLYGESSQDHLVGIIVPDAERASIWAKSNEVEIQPMGELIKDERFIASIKKEMREVESELKGFERVKEVKLVATPFSLENGLLTPTMKKIRYALYHHFKADIDVMYESTRKASLMLGREC